MNANLFRLVFNAARGQVMAVSEVATACGKTASGETRSSRVNTGSNQPQAVAECAQAAIKIIVLSVASVCALWAFPSAHAQIVADTAAAGNLRPMVSTTANGVPQVNIQTPSAAGVSRNVYSQFDVKANGAVLNNSSANVQTQLGGWVQGNSNLASGAARVILNEVNSSNPSQLNGFVEVAGQRAEVIIANPAGIAVNGGGFINASGVTLTTGAPQLSGGNLDGYRVQTGNIAFTGSGLDTSTADYTNIIARAVQVNAGIWAKDLKVTTGANTVNAANTSATSIAGTGAAPAFALDVAAIGGMYANKITLIGTETGMGVNNAGTIAASNGNLVLQANGMLTNTGVIDSQGATVLKATTLNNTGTGRIYGNSVAIGANTLNNAPATVGGTAPVIAARGLAGAGRMDIGVGTLNNQEGAVIYSQGDLAIGGSLDANNQATGRATRITNNSAAIESMGSMDIKSVDLQNTYDSLSYRVEVAATTPGGTSCGADCTVTYTETTYRAIAVPGTNGPGKILSADALTIDATGLNVNKESQILAGTTLNITGTVVDNQAIEVALNKEQRGTAAQRYTWTTCYPCEEHAGYHYSAYSNDIPDNQFISRGVATTSGTPNSGRTVAGASALPTSSQYRINNALGAAYLVETDPRFINMHTWLGSDYMLRMVTLDPSVTQKRLGDGFYEQRLINEQVAQLTGRRFFANYTSDEQQYQALMDAGVTYAQTFNLRPGIALSASQVAQLTSDIVWLVEKEVTLKDGSKQKALVPQVYAMVREGDLSNTGALISGKQVNIATSGDITNNGAILGRQVINLSANNINNMGGGLIQSDTVNASARQDINVIGGTIAAQSALTVDAGRDLNVQSTTRQTSNGGGSDTSAKGVAGMLGGSGSGGSGVKTSNETITHVAGLYVTGTGGSLQASAGNDINLKAAAVQSTGDTRIAAGRNLNLQTVTTSNSFDATVDAGNYNRNSQSTEVGTSIQSAGNTTLTASNDIRARAASVQSQGELVLAAGGSVAVEAGQATRSDSSGRTTSGASFFASSTTTDRNASSSTQAVGSDLGGRNVAIISGKDLGIKGSSVLADKDLTLAAAGNVTIEAAQNTSRASSFHQKTESGLMSNGGLSVTLGEQQQSTDQGQQSTSAAASTVGSVGGNVTITAGKNYTQTGSDVVTPVGDVNITAQKVDITAQAQDSSSQTDTQFKQSGLTLSISNPVVAAVQTLQGMAQAAEKVKSGRMQALAGLTAGASGYNAYNDVQKGQGSTIDGKSNQIATMNPDGTPGSRDANAADKAGGVNVNLSLGSSESSSHSSSQSTTQRGSSINAGRNVNIKATGDAQASDITVTGSAIQAQGTVDLDAQHKLVLASSQSTTLDTSTNSSSSSSVGAGYSSNSGLNVNAAASQSAGRGNGSSVTQNNTLIQGKTVAIKSGGDTELLGALIKADKVIAAIQGDLIIESRQDTDTYKENSSSSGGSISVGTQGGSASLSRGKTRVDSDYASVTQQSGIQTGDNGFDIRVGGKTKLVGGVIATTDQGVALGNNKLTSAGGIETKDIANSASYQAERAQVTVGTSVGSSSAGVGSDSGNAASTTKAGVSGIAGNTAARTGDQETGIAKIFDKAQVLGDINAQVTITTAAGQQLPRATATFADKQKNDLLNQAKAARAANNEEQADALVLEAKKWDEGGRYRTAIHTALGALSGGVGGAVGAGTVAANADNLNDLQDQLKQSLVKAGASAEVASGIANVTFTSGALAAGNALGGATGAASALNVDANNRQLHVNEITLVKSRSKQFAEKLLREKGVQRAPTQAEISQAETRLLDQADRNVNSQSDLRLDGAAAAYLSGLRNELAKAGQDHLPGGANYFYAGPDQYFDTGMYKETLQTQMGKDAYQRIEQGNTGALTPNYYYKGNVETINKEAEQVNKATLDGLIATGKCLATAGVTCIYDGLKGYFQGKEQLENANTRKETEQGMAEMAGGALNIIGGRSLVKSHLEYGANGEIPALSSNARIGLREELAGQASIPRTLDKVWGSTADDLAQTFKLDGAQITAKAPLPGTSGKAEAFEVKGHPLISEYQYHPGGGTHGDGTYYKFVYKDGLEVRVIDPNSGFKPGTIAKNQQYFDNAGNRITYVAGKWVSH